MITISLATTQPIEDENSWSYPVEELDYLLETADKGTHYLLWENRLYETTKKGSYNMNKLDKLMVLNAQLDAVIDDIKNANKHLAAELKMKRDALQGQMFDDIAALRGYMKKVGMHNVELNTGVVLTDRGDVATLKISTHTTDVGVETTRGNFAPTFHRWVRTNIPFADEDYGYDGYVKEYIFTILQHWDVAYANMQDDLFNQMQDFMSKKASEVVNQQRTLVAELERFD